MTLLFLILLALSASAVLACPNCKNGHIDSDVPGASERLSEGIFWSYIGMTSMPFLSVGSIAGLLLHSRRKQRLAMSLAQNTNGKENQ